MDTKKSTSQSSFGQKLDLSAVRVPAQLKGLNPFAILIGAAIGGAVMYMCDPVAGANRRSTLLARVKGFSTSTTTGVSQQLSGLSGLVSNFISSWFSAAPSSTASDFSASAEAAAKGTTTSTFARKVAATDPDAYTATH